MASYVAVLPNDVLSPSSSNSSMSFLRLPHPRTGIPSLFLPYTPTTSDAKGKSKETGSGILEVHSISPTNQRSWFLDDGADEVIENGSLLLMTPIDPAFLLLPVLIASMPKDGTQGTFRPPDDLFEDSLEKYIRSTASIIDSKDPSSEVNVADLRTFGEMECVKLALRRICEVKEITPEITVLRPSQSQLITYLRSKVARLTASTKSSTLHNSPTILRSLAKDGLLEDGKEELLKLGRTRAACDLISQFVPPPLYKDLLDTYDFTALDTYLTSIRPPPIPEDAGKPKKKTKGSNDKNDNNDAGKKRKATKESTGVEKLKKVNTKGMAKLSSFFQAKGKGDVK
ncbi:ribonuclease H2, subunit B [Abortiporus biennis]|nr:ribonuclease H2, subunit B [Abortiporus biennis]